MEHRLKPIGINDLPTCFILTVTSLLMMLLLLPLAQRDLVKRGIIESLAAAEKSQKEPWGGPIANHKSVSNLRLVPNIRKSYNKHMVHYKRRGALKDKKLKKPGKHPHADHKHSKHNSNANKNNINSSTTLQQSKAKT